MTIEFLRHFYRATDPGKPLFAQDPEDQKLYIDFSEVRGGQIIEELKDNITFFSPDSPTCSLFHTERSRGVPCSPDFNPI